MAYPLSYKDLTRCTVKVTRDCFENQHGRIVCEKEYTSQPDTDTDKEKTKRAGNLIMFEYRRRF